MWYPEDWSLCCLVRPCPSAWSPKRHDPEWSLPKDSPGGELDGEPWIGNTAELRSLSLSDPLRLSKAASGTLDTVLGPVRVRRLRPRIGDRNTCPVAPRRSRANARVKSEVLTVWSSLEPETATRERSASLGRLLMWGNACACDSRWEWYLLLPDWEESDSDSTLSLE